MRRLWLPLLLLVLPGPVLATDGVLEINQTCAAGDGCFPGDAGGFPVTIVASGSYRLTSDLVVPDADTDGCMISANDVGIDLNGFTIQRSGCEASPLDCTPALGSGVGVRAEFRDGISVANGNVTGMGSDGLILGHQARVSKVGARWNARDGIVVGPGSTVSESRAFDNGAVGVRAAIVATVSGNVAYLNGSVGIQAGEGSTISGNAVLGNGSVGISTTGSVVSGNVAATNGDEGIRVTSSSRVSRNEATRNTGAGIRVGERSHVLDNQASANGGPGILVTSDENRIDGNHLTSNQLGIDVDGSVNLIVRNSARANSGGNYEIVENNRVGLIVVPPLSGAITANGPGAGLGTTDPWANFAF